MIDLDEARAIPRDWGTAITYDGDPVVISDHPAMVIEKVLGAGADSFVQFTTAPGYADENRIEDAAFLPSRPLWVRAKEIYSIEPLPPEYMAWHARGYD